MATFIGQKVECMMHSFRMQNNKGKYELKPFPIEKALAKTFIMDRKSPICQRCGFKCLNK